LKPELKIAKIFAPISLKIGVKAPEEIAVSIIAQVIEVKRGKK
jgi:xanthine/CO dehydrogenase XdhC/CoxF family maturation factor